MKKDITNRIDQRKIEEAITDISADVSTATDFTKKIMEISMTLSAMLTLVQQKLEDLYVSLETEKD